MPEYGFSLAHISRIRMHCVKSVRIRSYSGPYSVRMRENTDQIDSEYGEFLGSDRINDYTLLQKNKGQRKPVF